MELIDYYEALEADINSSTEEIQRAYRKLARRYHPDINPGDEAATQRYREITEAQQVLTNPEARAKYDRLRASWQAHQQANPDEAFAWSTWVTGVELTGQENSSDEILSKLDPDESRTTSDFYEIIFGGMDVGDQTALEQAQDYHQTVEISLEEAFAGTSRILRVGGRRLEVRIPKGAQTGTKVRVRGEGATGTGTGQKGDIYLEIKVKPHAYFNRTDDDLQLDLPVNLYSAILGGEAIVSTLKGKIKLRIPPETQSGRVFRLKGLGMPNLKNPEERGDLYARVMITLPENLTDEEIELFEELADIRGL